MDKPKMTMFMRGKESSATRPGHRGRRKWHFDQRAMRSLTQDPLHVLGPAVIGVLRDGSTISSQPDLTGPARSQRLEMLGHLLPVAGHEQFQRRLKKCV